MERAFGVSRRSVSVHGTRTDTVLRLAFHKRIRWVYHILHFTPPSTIISALIYLEIYVRERRLHEDYVRSYAVVKLPDRRQAYQGTGHLV